VSCRWFAGIILLEIKGRALPSGHGCVGSPSWLPNHVRRADAADEWAWSPLVVNGVPCGQDDNKAEMLSTSCTIPGVGLDRPSHHTTLIFDAV
jgi:hypothetical protein